jgi:hypothetical protein
MAKIKKSKVEVLVLQLSCPSCGEPLLENNYSREWLLTEVEDAIGELRVCECKQCVEIYVPKRISVR